MEITRLPPIQLSTHQDTALSWQWREGQTPVDLTSQLDGVGWSARFQIQHHRADVFSAAMTIDARGGLTVSVPASAAVSLRSCRRIDAIFQITITAPIPELSEIWTGPVVVQETHR